MCSLYLTADASGPVTTHACRREGAKHKQGPSVHWTSVDLWQSLPENTYTKDTLQRRALVRHPSRRTPSRSQTPSFAAEFECRNQFGRISMSQAAPVRGCCMPFPALTSCQGRAVNPTFQSRHQRTLSAQPVTLS